MSGGPINCASGDLLPGIGIELAKEIFEPLGYRVQYIVMPWARALVDVRDGKIDAAIGANASDDPTLLFPKTPICDITDDFYVLSASTIQYKDMESLEGKRVGIIQDYGYGSEITHFISRHRKNQSLIQVTGGDVSRQAQ
jgi:polar amino acid transport system substrate-binding protein